MDKIRIGIYGYGNLSRGIETNIGYFEDMELSAVFSRRKVKTVSGAPVYPCESAEDMQKKIDVMILCGGSASDLPEQTPVLARHFNVVDSFDTHARIPGHFAAVDEAAKKSGHAGIISVGWDPGMFSVNRLYMDSVLPNGKNYTFWGRGVSQGHSDAIRCIDGVLDARQYTVPVEEAVSSVRSGTHEDFTAGQMHRRECYVVAEEGADRERIRREIVSMPNYFADYDTEVYFISGDELKKEHSGMPHGGCVIRSGNTGRGVSHVAEYSLKLDSNPEFTAGVLLAFARAAHRLYINKDYGCKTIFDIPPAYLSALQPEELRARML